MSYTSILDKPRKGPPRKRIKCIVLGAAGAGKTSLLRRYFRGTFEGTRVPTLGSDFYTGRIVQQQEEKKEEKNVSSTAVGVSVQVWDTAGRERNAKHPIASLSDEFFRHADGAMLVYDATSSTSFTQLLKWHSELRQRKFDRPILIVANKMDIIKERQLQRQQQQQQLKSSSNNLTKTAAIPNKRDVMGIMGGDFKGKDSQYEYRVDTSHNNNSNTPSAEDGRSTYMATHGSAWTTDGCYLDSVLNSESRSHPDRDMVLLWCMRNDGLTHVEASALDGTGVDEAMESLVSLALEYKAEQERKEEQQFQQETQARFRTNKELDLHKRYAPQGPSCFGFLFQWCKPEKK